MGIFYYVINLPLLLVFSILHMNKFWTEEKFDSLSKGLEKEDEK